ncbi:MAG: Rrf2 family transcriptional regulator [Myxococcota bacterium]
MKLSAQEEYGLRCLIQVARRAPTAGCTPVAIREVAEAEGLSLDYAAKLLRVLRQGELLESERGACGGYRLARPAASIAMTEVMKALDTPMFAGDFCESHAGQRDSCVHAGGGCAMRPLWREIEAAVYQVLARRTLADLLVESEPVRIAAAGG